MFARPAYKNNSLQANPPLRFPQKLWKIANECQSGAVCWSPDGKSVLIRYSLFRDEFMSTKSDFFKTDNISSFVRQLNLYGFRKVYDHAHKQAYKANPDLHEFSNACFQRDRPELLDKVTRKSGVLKERNDLWPQTRKNLDFVTESSFNIWDESNVSADKNDHAYLRTRENKSPTSDPQVVALEEKIIAVVETIHQREASPRKEDTPRRRIHDSQPIAVLPSVKKKRGRKPGIKRNLLKFSRNLFEPTRKIYYSPILKNSENYPEFIYFDDDDDDIFLRNTSRDVMLSSTLPFQETPEYLELKETYDRLYDPKMRSRCSLFPFSIGKFA